MTSLKDMNENEQVLKFAPFASTAEASFWTNVADLKLNVLRLDEGPVDVLSTFAPPQKSNQQDMQQQPPRMRWDHTSLTISEQVSARNELIHCRGTIKLLNTVEAMKRLDKEKLVKDIVLPRLIDQALDGDNPELLSCFSCVAYLDLKKHTVLYWFLFPALSPPSAHFTYTKIISLRAFSGDIACDKLASAVIRMRLEASSLQCPPYFLVLNLIDCTHDSSVKCIPLSLANFRQLSQEEKETAIFAFVDPSSMPHNPGWPMRNLLAFVALKIFPGIVNPPSKIKVLAYRPGIIRRITPGILDHLEQDQEVITSLSSSHEDQSLLFTVPVSPDLLHTPDDWKILGWEMNARNKPGPRMVNLSTIFDPVQLASQSVDLNLKLMKWRLLPNLKTDILAHHTKCLLLGAGTLGCNVARTLLGWGVRHITLVDNGRVSYSNPVRQSLFDNNDCLNGGSFKALAAAEALKRIFPGVKSQGIVLSIPMPGHSLGTTPQAVQEAQATVSQLDSLIESHHVIFLLTDTRESRWLPTLMAVSHDKMLINAALGLDSWLVMRHGRGHINEANDHLPQPLGCYFCNDVVAPSDSMKERTMDQQCTVTRPGLAPIASAMAVELMVALLHLPQQHWTLPNTQEVHSDLGSVPHQIRGFLSSYQLMTPTTPRFDSCTACSLNVVQHYKSQGFEFIQKVTDDTSGGMFLEELTGLASLKRCADQTTSAWDVDNDGDAEADDW